MLDASYAEHLLQEYGVTTPEEIDLEAIAYDQGASVKYRSLDGCEARIVGMGCNAIITIDPAALPERQRFSLAHEIGHWLQDRGTISYDCKKADIGPRKAAGSTRESAANRFASQLLMPDYLFVPLCAKKPITFETVAALGKIFKTSLTSTALKLVRVGNSPAMVTCHKNRKLEWLIPGPDVPAALQRLWPLLDEDTQASELMSGQIKSRGTQPRLIGAESWIDEPNAGNYTLIEHSIMMAEHTVVTLLWWKDESQISDCQV